MNRRMFLRTAAASALLCRAAARASQANGQRLAVAALAQVGVTVAYDPTWTAIPYPGGDVPRTTGVCADVIIRAARDGLGMDLQKLVHEDMVKHFDAYPARSAWREKRPDVSIDHRRVLNLQTYFERAGSQIWRATSPVSGDAFPMPLEVAILSPGFLTPASPTSAWWSRFDLPDSQAR